MHFNQIHKIDGQLFLVRVQIEYSVVKIGFLTPGWQ